MQASPAGVAMVCSRKALGALVASTVAAVLLRADLQPQLVSMCRALRGNLQRCGGLHQPPHHTVCLQDIVHRSAEQQWLAWLYLTSHCLCL